MTGIERESHCPTGDQGPSVQKENGHTQHQYGQCRQ